MSAGAVTGFVKFSDLALTNSNEKNENIKIFYLFFGGNNLFIGAFLNIKYLTISLQNSKEEQTTGLFSYTKVLIRTFLLRILCIEMECNCIRLLII